MTCWRSLLIGKLLTISDVQPLSAVRPDFREWEELCQQIFQRTLSAAALGFRNVWRTEVESNESAIAKMERPFL